MKTISSTHFTKQPATPWGECRQWKDAQEASSPDKAHATDHNHHRIKKYHQTRWNRLSKMTAPNALIILIKHQVLAIGAFAGTLVSISLLLPSLFEHRYLLAAEMAILLSLLPSALKSVTGFLFHKSWSYRHCVTPFVMIACGFSALPGALLIKKGPPRELVTSLQSQQVEKANGDQSAPSHETPRLDTKKSDEVIAQL